VALTITDLKKSYMMFDYPLERYIPIVILSTLGILAFVIAASIYLPILFANFLVSIIMWFFPVFVLFVGVIYPLLIMERVIRITNRLMHLFITRMSILSTSTLPRKDMIKIISEVKEYGPLATEISRIYTLMGHWNSTLPDAARFIGKRTPSPILGDFLDRMAHAIDAGEDFHKFMIKEQKVVILDFELRYDNSLKSMDTIRELLTSLIVSSMFIIIFMVILPALLAQTGEAMLLGVVFLFVFIEGAMTFAVYNIMPEDELWHNMERRPPFEYWVKGRMPFFVAATGILSILLSSFRFEFAYAPILPGIVFLPLALIGRKVKFEEEQVRRCDYLYDTFMRSVASGAANVGGSLVSALKDIKLHDFGPLSEHIDMMYKRLATRIDKIQPWAFFAADTGSNLIAKFTEMFVKGVNIGGDPEEIANIVSENFLAMNNLRKKRAQTSANVQGLMYGLTAAITITLFMALNLMLMMNGIFSEAPITGDIAIPLNLEGFDMVLMSTFMISIILIHALFSAIILNVVTGSHKIMILYHFPLLSFFGAVTAVITNLAMKNVLGIA